MTERPIVLAANWKMHKDRDEAIAYADSLSAWIDGNLTGQAGSEHVQVIVAPGTLHVDGVISQSPSFGVFAQDVHPEPLGAYTGNVSAPQLADLGADGVIVGHSERRQLHGETSEEVAGKAAAAIAAHLRPIICVGETLDERESGRAEEVVRAQLEPVLARMADPRHPQWGYVAYEPVWAIGTGRTATPGQAQQMHAQIRRQLVAMLGEHLGNLVPILYGGSVKPANIGELLAEDDIDGALVGGASLQVESFSEIIEAGLRAASAVAAEA